MKIHYLQHVPFEDLSSIEPILREKGHELTATHLYEGEQLPSVKEIDWLIVMGGPMGIYDEAKYPWLNLPFSSPFLLFTKANQLRPCSLHRLSDN